MLYDRYWNNNQMFSSICFEELENTWSQLEVSEFICEKFGFAEGSMEEGDASGDDMMMMMNQIQSLDLTYYDESTGYWDFTPSMNGKCTERRSEVVVECTASEMEQGCLQSGEKCATDLDCCNRMFCCPATGSCLDPGALLKRSLYTGCTSDNECESGQCIMTATPPICSVSIFMSTGMDQYLYLSFTPYNDENMIAYSSNDIIDSLNGITKIDHHYFEFQGTITMNTMGVTYYRGTWKIQNNLQTRAKILSLRKMLDYDDGEQFKTIFNRLYQFNEIYVVDVSGLGSIAGQSGVLDLGIQPWWDMDNVLGLGWLHTMDRMTSSMRMFCPKNVCSPCCSTFEDGTCFSIVVAQLCTVGSGRNPSRVSNGMLMLIYP